MRPIAPVARIMNVEIEGWHMKAVLGSQLSCMEVETVMGSRVVGGGVNGVQEAS